MKCPSCGERKLVRDTRDIPYTYKGETTTIPAVRGEFCPACGESVLGAAESKRVSAAMLEFNKQVNASIVDPGFIARVRKKLALDQRQAAEIFGGGVNAFSVFVAKPFVAQAPDAEPTAHPWISGELLTHYRDWHIDYFLEEVVDCTSSGVPHQHAVNRMVARRPSS